MGRFVSAILICSFSLLGGCAISLPLNERLSYKFEEKATELDAQKQGPIAVKWVPADFPERVDIQGASGFVGGGSRTRVPTGVAMASRINNVLDKAIGIDKASPNILTLNVLSAKSQFKYGFASSELTYGAMQMQIKFEYAGSTWTESFSSEVKSGLAQTFGYRLENAWDQVAYDVGRSVVSHVQKANSNLSVGARQ